MSSSSWVRRCVAIAAAFLLCAAARPIATPGVPDPTSVREVVTIDTAAPLVPDAQGVDAAIATSEMRRQRARWLSRSPLAKVRVVNDDGSVSFFLRNRLHAPVTVEVEQGGARGATVQMLSPLHATIAALEQLEVARIKANNVLEPGEVDFEFSAVAGDPKARHDDRVLYGWPLPPGAAARVTQGRGGPTHREMHAFHAIDLAVAEGTPVLAARAGVVVFLENRYFESGLDRAKFISRSNQVRILHEDGSMASYAHLFPDSIDLEPGQRVELGQRIGLSGNTGYSSGPHLHFAVVVHRDMQMVSVPFRMRGLD